MAKVGRPLKFETAEEMDIAINEYFDGESSKITIAGLCYHLGFDSRQSFHDYMKREEFSYVIKRARLRLTHIIEMKLYTGQPAAGPIFALKQLGYSDTQEVNLNHSGHINTRDMTDAQLDAQAALYQAEIDADDSANLQ
jgi:hypothetical protein